MIDSENLKKDLRQIQSSVQSDYDKMLPVWKQVAEYSQSFRGRFPNEERYAYLSRSDRVISSALQEAGTILSAGMQSGLTNQSTKWFKLSLADKDLMKFKAAKEWLFDVENVLYGLLNKSNFYDITPGAYKEMGFFGQASVLQEKSFKTGTRFYTYTCGEYMFGQNDDLEIDTHFRILNMTLAQLVRRFGLNKLPLPLKANFDNGQVSQTHVVIHAVLPNYYRIKGKIDNKNMPFLSVYYLRDIENGFLLNVSGYKRFPYHTPRWETVSSDLYGIAPAFNALNKSLSIQKMNEARILATEYQVRPPWNVPKSIAEGIYTPNLLPGGSTVYDDSRPEARVTPTFQVQFDTQNISMLIKEMEENIFSHMHSDIFRMISMSDKSMTATEVAIRKEEKVVLLGPVLNNLHRGFLAPTIYTTFEHAMELDLLPPPPPELIGQDLGIEFNSMLAQAQKMVDTQASVEFAGFVGQIAQFNPNALKKLNANELIDDYAEKRNVNPRIVNSNDDVEQMIQAEQEAQMQARQMEMAMQTLEGAKTLSDISRNNKP
jgi:hypothetical protein